MAHLTWSIEKANLCPKCGGETVLIVASMLWGINGDNGYDGEDVEVHEEVTGHYCKLCQLLVSLSLNT